MNLTELPKVVRQKQLPPIDLLVHLPVDTLNNIDLS